jgi:putative FmdB family regulatory protein
MPTYEYRCEGGHTFEVMQRMTDEPVSVCATCSRPVQRVFHPVAVHFKGKGFYNTDYGTRRRQRELAAAGEGGSGDSSKKSSKETSGSESAGSKSDTKSKSQSTEGKSASSPPKPSASGD